MESAAAAAEGGASAGTGPAAGARSADRVLRATVARLERELAECQRVRPVTLRELARATTKSARLEAALEAERGRAADGLREAESALRSAQAECARLEARAGELQNDLDSAANMGAALGDRLEEELNRIADLESDLEAERLRSGRFADDLRTERGHSAWLREQLPRLQEFATDAQLKRDAVDARVLSLEAERTALVGEVRRLRAAAARGRAPPPIALSAHSRERRAAGDGASVASSADARPASPGSASPVYGPSSPAGRPRRDETEAGRRRQRAGSPPAGGA